MKKLLILLLLMVPIAMAAPLEADSSLIKVDVSNILEIEPKSPNYRVDEVEASLSWIPAETYRQEVMSINTEPMTESLGEEAVFRWKNPEQRELWIKLTGTVRTEADYYPVTTHIDFPIRNVDSKLSRYLGEKDIIDINEDIEEKAAELAEGKDDLYDVVFTLAKWVNENIDYTLDTVTADASQKSSWVLENRRGVCDEMTSLYISMLRSLGIPARFAYGQAYTNAYIDSTWGSHGWAEVWFPDYGWVPIDPTYGQYGYLDPGHVKMGHSEDARKPSLKYSIASRNAGISSGFLDINAQVISEDTPMKTGINLETDAYFAETGLNSHNLITATVTNKDNVYKPITIQAISPEEVDVEDPKQYILLKPGEMRRVNWIVKAEELREGYIYTFPVRIVTDRRAESQAVYKSQVRARNYERDFFEELTAAKEKDKPYNRFVALNCNPTKGTLYSGDSTELVCSITNEGSRDLLDVSICLEKCKNLDLLGGESGSATFTASYDDPGVKNVVVTAKNAEVSKTSYTRISIIDGADVGLSMDAPLTANYDEDISIKFNITIESKSAPRNVRVQLSSKGGTQDWNLGSLQGPQKFDVKVNTDGFGFTNRFTLDVWYEDELGKEYHESTEESIEIAPMSFGDQIRALLNTVGWKLYGIFT